MMNWKITEGSYSEQFLRYLLSMRLQDLTKSTTTSVKVSVPRSERRRSRTSSKSSAHHFAA